MKILIALTYYRPWVSGLTIYVERLARALADQGHQVTVLTSRYDRRLPGLERLDGVSVVRVPVWLRVSKGVVMPTIGLEATRQVLRHDVLSLHLPQLDAAGIALRARLLGRPTVLTYHCDLRLPRGFVNRMADRVVRWANHAAARLADRVVAYTEDYAVHSPFLSRYLPKLHVIPPPVEVPPVSAARVGQFGERHIGGEGPVIGMAARLATEKGVEYLLEALPWILERHPRAKVLFAGQHENVLGEAEYLQRLRPLLERAGDRWVFLGVLDPAEMTAFYRSCDVTVLPSVNSTEGFGLVQIESMICGTPVVASDLPGVRQPVRTTGMGEVVPIRDARALASAILAVLEKPDAYRADGAAIARDFSPARTAEGYVRLFEELLLARRGGDSASLPARQAGRQLAAVSRQMGEPTDAPRRGPSGGRGQGEHSPSPSPPRERGDPSHPLPPQGGEGGGEGGATRDFLWPHIRDLPYFRASLRAVEARLVHAVELPPPVLDLGCGDGHFASVAFCRPIDVGIDPAARPLREARGRAAHRALIQAEGARLPHPDGWFASAFSNSVLEHIPALDPVLAELARVLRPGAPLVITAPNPGYRDELSVPRWLGRVDLARLGGAYADWFMRMSRTWNLLDEAGWAERLERHGFVVERTQRYFSPAALRYLEWGHYFGAPCLLVRCLTGRWILVPRRWNLWLTERRARRYYEQSPGEDGTYTFLLARRK